MVDQEGHMLFRRKISSQVQVDHDQDGHDDSSTNPFLSCIPGHATLYDIPQTPFYLRGVKTKK